MRPILILLLATFLADAAHAQEVEWGRVLLQGNSVNTNRAAFAARTPDGNIVVDIGRFGFRFEMTVLDDDSGEVESSRITNHQLGFDSSSILTSTGDYIRYAITPNGIQPRGILSSIDTATGALNWEHADQPVRFELNIDAAGNVYVLEHDGSGPTAPLQMARYDANGVRTPITTMGTASTPVVALDRVNGMPGWSVATESGYQICRLGAALSCAPMGIPASDSVRKIRGAPGGGAYVEIFRPTIGFELARFSDSGTKLWQRPISDEPFGWDAWPTGIPILVADDASCSEGHSSFRVHALDGSPGAPVCIGFGSDGTAARLADLGSDGSPTHFTDLGTHWAVSLGLTGTPRIIDKRTGQGYWLRLSPTHAQTMAFTQLVPLNDSEFAVVSKDWQEQQREFISVRRIRLVDTLFRETFEYFAP